MTHRPQPEDGFSRSGDDRPTLSPFKAGLRQCCPRCGEGRLFTGFLTLAERCAACGLDYSRTDSGDGPAVFVILVVGFVVTAAALVLETTLAPPQWVHMILWIPAILVLSIGLLRPFKATLIALQYHHGAREGRRIDSPHDR